MVLLYTDKASVQCLPIVPMIILDSQLLIPYETYFARSISVFARTRQHNTPVPNEKRTQENIYLLEGSPTISSAADERHHFYGLGSPWNICALDADTANLNSGSLHPESSSTKSKDRNHQKVRF